ncbi:LCP family protein [Nocardia sp. NBC_00508]|uniref:LCP family protein n=1 Tax=Nocardia sp. NBC_00508 TaxID=2975992 RepID=UPI002E80C7F9|nr:LCP family protein [Nocardia sp. NBC_00508]WUD63839.1 LCP family protein [Nocardia sp. NBC_00508]
MGDDRHGRSPRPGGRAPWERYPEEDYPERDAARTPRRARHTDAAPDQGSAPLTVQDLVQRVDNERAGRGGRRATAPPDGGAPNRGRRAESDPVDAGPPPGRGRRAEPAPPDAGPIPGRGRRGEPMPPAGPASPPAGPAGRPPGPAARPGRPAEPTRRPPDAANGRGAAAGPRRAPDAPAPRQTGNSPVVQDIAGERAAPASRSAGRHPAERSAPPVRPEPEQAEEVTDVLPPLTEPTRAKRKGAGWPTKEGKAQPKSVGTPAQSRLEAARERRNKRLRTIGRVAMAVVAVLVLLTTGGGWSYMRSTTDSFTQVSALDENSQDIVDSNAQLGDENYLLVGTDTRAGANGKLGAGTLDDAEGSRADTTMLVHIPKNRSRVVVVSFPRDLDVTRPQCTGWDNEKSRSTDEKYPSAIGDKLNAIYNLGGPPCLVSTIQRLTGASINHFIGIDFAGFETMVNRIDGVEVCATKPLVDDVLGTILEKPGKQRINGETALNYVRARHVYGEERSDYDRINRQQRFLASLLRGALASKVLFDLGKLNGFIKEFTDHTLVDEKTRPEDLLMLGRSLQKIDAGTVTFITVPTAGTTSYGNEIPRESDIKAIFKAIRDDQPLPGEKPTVPKDIPAPTPATPTPTKYTAVDPSTVSLLVSNGSGHEGLARTAATKLGNQGFTIYNTGNYANGNSATTKVRYAAGLEAEAATVATAIPGATIEAADDLGGIVEVVIGADSTNGVTVKAPTPVGDTITNVATSTSKDSTPTVLPSDLEHVNAAEEICK